MKDKPSPEMKIKLLLADRQQIFLDGIESLLARQRGMKVVAKVGTAQAAVQQARALAPHMVVMEIFMPDFSGIEATRQIVTHCPRTRVLILSVFSHRLTVARAFHAGATGYILKEGGVEELFQATRAVAAGRIHLSSRVTGIVIEDYMKNLSRIRSLAFPELTPREQEVLQISAEGRNTKASAAALHVSVKTINSHRKQIMNKLGFQSQADLVKYAIREGLITLDHP